MRLRNHITLKKWDETPEYIRYFIINWMQHYYPGVVPIPDLRQSLELLSDVTRNYHRESNPPSRFFNNVLENIDSVVAWDDDGEGGSLIETVHDEIIQAVKHLLIIRSKT